MLSGFCRVYDIADEQCMTDLWLRGSVTGKQCAAGLQTTRTDLPQAMQRYFDKAISILGRV